MSDQTQNTREPERKDLKNLGAMSMEEALPIIMEQYQVDRRKALELWVNYGPPTGFEDSIGLSPEEADEYMKEVKKTSLGSFKLTFKKRRGTEDGEKSK